MPSFHLRAYSLWNTQKYPHLPLPVRDKVHPEFLVPFKNAILWETAGGCCTNTQATWLLSPSLLGLRLLLESGSSQRPACSTLPLLPLATKWPSTCAPSLWPSAHWQVGGTSIAGECSSSHGISCPFLSWGQGMSPPPGHMACSAHWSTGTLDSQHSEPGGESPRVSPYPLFYITGAQIWYTPERFSFPSQSILLPSKTGRSSSATATMF